ncbi:MAG: hypothetical protein Q7J35_01850, partial [Candidatus Methanoperedens sp.]|nr:hypothetical protein [Candidatus Methanoperedens sp.]
LSCKLQTPALLPTHVTVGLPQMEGVACSAICDATFMSRRAICVLYHLTLFHASRLCEKQVSPVL